MPKRILLPALTGLLLGLSACGGGGVTTSQGSLADEVIADFLDDLGSAWSKARKSDALANIGDDARCYLGVEDADGDTEPTEEAFCGPIAVRGAPGGAVWDVFYAGVMKKGGEAVLDDEVLEYLEFMPGAAPTERPDDVDFYRPDGQAPAEDAEALEPPPAPAAESGYIAYVQPEEVVVTDEVEFDDSRLVTPLYEIRLLSVATTEEVGTGAEAVSAAEGEKFVVARMIVNQNDTYDERCTSDACYDDDLGSATQIFAELGSTRPDITDGIAFNGDGEQLVVMSAPADDTGLLTISVHGVEQSLSLTTGERTTAGLADGSYRDVTSIDATQTVPVKSFTKGDFESEYGINFKAAWLDSYDAGLGWAPEGKAWLRVSFEEILDDGWGYDIEFLPSSMSAVVDGKKTPLKSGYPITGYGNDGTLAFEVPADMVEAEVTAAPVARFSTSNSFYSPKAGDATYGSKTFTLNFS